MNLEQTLIKIIKNVSKWENRLNEAQTCQAMVLLILEKLGYDIWNPFEVYPQQHSGGGSWSYIPDFYIYLNQQPRFIIEVKAMNKNFTANEQKQTVNYINSEGLRWAILTNGIQWLFFDNEKKGVVTDKLVFQFNLTEKTEKLIKNYLMLLLSAQVWKLADANEQISQHIAIINLSQQLWEILLTGFEKNEAGLKLAIQYTLNNEESQLAQKHFDKLLNLVLLNKNSPSSPDRKDDLEKLLGEKIQQASQSSKHKNITIMKLNQVEIAAKN